MNKMIVRLKSNPEEISSWLFFDSKGELIEVLNEKNINNADIFILVPGRDVFMTELKLPKLSKKQLTNAIPFAIEENLSEEKESFHFAIGKVEKDSIYPVAAIKKQKMDSWRLCWDIFFKVKFPFIKQCIPDMLALPWAKDTWTVFIENKLALVKTGIQAGFCIESDEFWLVFDLFLQKPSSPYPRIINIFGELNIPVDQQKMADEKNIVLNNMEKVEFLKLVSPSVESCSPIDLLQGDYNQSLSYFKKEKFYLSFVILGLIFFVLSFGSVLQYLILDKNEAKIRQNNLAIFSKILPSKQVLTNSNMKKETQKLIKSKQVLSNKIDFLNMLNDLSPLFNISGIQLLGVTYEASKLTIKIEANNMELLDKINEKIKLKNYKVQLYEAIKNDRSVQANFLISGKSYE